MNNFLLLLREIFTGDATEDPGVIVETNGTLLDTLVSLGFAVGLDSHYFDPADLITPPELSFAGGASLDATTGLIDLTDLTNFDQSAGSTAFSLVQALTIFNFEPPGSGKTLLVGGSGDSTEWYAPFGTLGSTIEVPAGTQRTLYTQDAAGWAVGSRSIILLDSGENLINFTLAIHGA